MRRVQTLTMMLVLKMKIVAAKMCIAISYKTIGSVTRQGGIFSSVGFE